MPESGSGPGGRRFKSSLPDQSFQALERCFWFSVYTDGVEIVDGACIADFQTVFTARILVCLTSGLSDSIPIKMARENTHAISSRKILYRFLTLPCRT